MRLLLRLPVITCARCGSDAHSGSVTGLCWPCSDAVELIDAVQVLAGALARLADAGEQVARGRWVARPGVRGTWAVARDHDHHPVSVPPLRGL